MAILGPDREKGELSWRLIELTPNRHRFCEFEGNGSSLKVRWPLQHECANHRVFS